MLKFPTFQPLERKGAHQEPTVTRAGVTPKEFKQKSEEKQKEA